jgi:hypothetical protein
MSAAGLPRIAGLSELVEIGRSAYAVVYRGDRDGYPVAVKVFQAPGLSAGSRHRLDAEVAAIAGLSGHPCVVPVYGSGSLGDGRPFLVTEFCPGGSLALALTGGPLPVDAAVDVGGRVAAALAAAHQAGVVHRNVTPASVLLRASGEPALGDFGLSLRLELQAAAGLRGLDPAFTAPESLTSGEYTPAGDVYCLGLTLYALLAGTPPFPPRPGESPTRHLQRIFNDPPPAIPRSDIPADLGGLLHRMLAPRPADRPPAATIADRLVQLAAPDTPVATPWPEPGAEPAKPPVGPGAPSGVGGGASAMAPPRPAPEPSGPAFPPVDVPELPTVPKGEPRRGRRRAVLLAAAGAVAVGTAVTLVITLTGPDGGTATATPTPTQVTSAPTGDGTTGGGTPSSSPGVPAGYQVATGERGLTVAVPAGWTLTAGTNGQRADDPAHPGDFVTVAGIAAATGPLPAEVQALERGVQADPTISGYTRLIFRSTRYGAADAAVEWAYSFTKGGTRQRTAGRLWRINGADYSMFITAPEPDAALIQQVFEVMLRTAAPQ